MERRRFLIGGFAAAVVGTRHAFNHASATRPTSLAGRKRSESLSASTLRIFIDRKVIAQDCMKGYLLTQVAGEPSPTAACYVLERPPAGNAPYVSAIPAGTYSVR